MSKLCSKIDTCYKINMIRDKDILESQFAEAVREVCARCEDFTVDKPGESRLLTDEEMMQLKTPAGYFAVGYGFEEGAKIVSQAQAELTRKDLGRGEGSPKIICLCGSSRFIESFAVLAWEFEKEGNITLGLHYLPPSYSTKVPDHLAEAEGVSKRMDELHLRKIDLADEVFVINVNGYIGESTAREIKYAESLGKPVKYLEALKGKPKEE